MEDDIGKPMTRSCLSRRHQDTEEGEMPEASHLKASLPLFLCAVRILGG